MTLYQVPKHSPYQRSLRILSGGAIFSLLGILLFSFFEPAGLSDSIAHSIGWAAVAIMLASVLGLTLLSVKEATWKLKRKLRLEMSDRTIIQSSDDSFTVEIPLNNIESLQEYRGWLLIKGGEPLRQISVPREIDTSKSLNANWPRIIPLLLSKQSLTRFRFCQSS